MICFASRYNYGKSKHVDELQEIIIELLGQRKQEAHEVIDQLQPYIPEFLLQGGNQPTIVAYLDQTVKDLESVPLAIDTTFNIGEFYFTQTAYQNISVVSKAAGKHPWFPGPLLVHRSKCQDVFKYFWQAVKRRCPALENLTVFGTDKETAVYNGILSECAGSTVDLLGEEHVKANIEKKLEELKFPNASKRRIITDIFGSPNSFSSSAKNSQCLCDCGSEEEFIQTVSRMKEEWMEIEKSPTRNNPPKFVSYFEKHKEEKIRQCMTKFVREKAGVSRHYGQNPIEWMHYMTKKEIDDAMKCEGMNHVNAPLPATFAAMKARTICLYSEAVKALYGEGLYRVSEDFKDHQCTYDEWKGMEKERRENVIHHFFSARRQQIPTQDQCDKPSDQCDKPTVYPTVFLDEDGSPDTVTSACLREGDISTCPKFLSISAEEACIPVECVRLVMLQQIFHKAKFLLNEEGAIRQAASNHSRYRTVKSKDGGVPLLV
jgi:hypothetical protein